MEGIYAAEASERLTLYNLQTGETQTILVPVGGSGMVPIFDAASRRVAYTISADPALQINGLHAWGIYVRDITTGSDTLFGGPFLARPQDRPLASLPIAWVGEELVLDAYLPTSGEHNLGVWALDVTDAIPGETGFLEDYDRQVLSPQDVLPWFYRHPSVSPPGSVLAFFLYDYGHQPSCLDANRYEEGSTVALGVVPTTGGEPRVLVDVSSSDSMLASPLTWSPDGQRILFAQGQCQDMSTSFGWTLRIVDLRGNIAGEWSLEPVETVWWGAALWCSPDDIFYTRQRGGLWHLSLATGGSERVLSGGVRLAGCLP